MTTRTPIKYADGRVFTNWKDAQETYYKETGIWLERESHYYRWLRKMPPYGNNPPRIGLSMPVVVDGVKYASKNKAQNALGIDRTRLEIRLLLQPLTDSDKDAILKTIESVIYAYQGESIVGRYLAVDIFRALQKEDNLKRGIDNAKD